MKVKKSAKYLIAVGYHKFNIYTHFTAISPTFAAPNKNNGIFYEQFF